MPWESLFPNKAIASLVALKRFVQVLVLGGAFADVGK